MPDNLIPIRSEHPDIERSWSAARAQFREQARLALLARLEPATIKVTDPQTGQTRTFGFKLLKDPVCPAFDLSDSGEVFMTGKIEYSLNEVSEATSKLLIEQFRRAHHDSLAAMPSGIGIDHDGPPLPDNATEADLLAYTESLTKKAT